MNKDKIVIEFTEENLAEFLEDYYKTHRKTEKPIVEDCLPRSMNKIITITNRIVQNNHKKHRALYVEYLIHKLGLDKIGICETDLNIEFVFPTLVRHDLDNLLAGVKEILDPFSELGVILDDNYKIIKTLSASARYEKGIRKMIMTFDNCKYDVEATLIQMEKERIKREKRDATMNEKKKSKKKTTKKK